MQGDTTTNDDRATTPNEPVASLVLEHIASVVDALPSYAACDTDVWADAVTSWLRPLPTNRDWKQRHGHDGARRGRARWADRHPEPFEDLRGAVAGQVDAARAAWFHLNDVGLVTGDRDDIVTAVCRETSEAA